MHEPVLNICIPPDTICKSYVFRDSNSNGKSLPLVDSNKIGGLFWPGGSPVSTAPNEHTWVLNET